MTDLTLSNIETIGIGLMPVRDDALKVVGWITYHPRTGWHQQEPTPREAVRSIVKVLGKEILQSQQPTPGAAMPGKKAA